MEKRSLGGDPGVAGDRPELLDPHGGFATQTCESKPLDSDQKGSPRSSWLIRLFVALAK